MFCVVILHSRNQQHISSSANLAPQCAHWAIFRTAQLLGIPTGPNAIQRLLPNQPKGHTLVQIVETLAKIGVNAEGYRDNWDSLTKISFPCIAHLKNPDHYIVVSEIEPEQGYVHIFDDAGNRTRQKRETFEKRWTGYTLHIEKDKSFFNSKMDDSIPRAVFDHLILDKGDIPAVGEPIEFVFPVSNTGTADLVIEDVKVNCGCLKSEKPEHPIPPGKSDVIKLFYSIEPKRGVFTQTAAIKTNDPQYPVVVISACGFTGVDVRIEPSRIFLDRLFVGRKTVYRCFVRYTGEWNDFQVEVESADLTGIKLVQHECLPLDKTNFSNSQILSNTKISQSVAKNNRLLELTFEPTGNISEKISGTVKLKTNVSGYEHFTLNVSGTIELPIRIFPNVIDLKEDKEHTVTLISLVDKPFSIAGVDCDPVITCQYGTSMKNEQQLHLVKNGVLKSNNFVIHCQLDKEQSTISIPLTLLADVP
jgi:hypothetical protein